jgi:hypothetical protein
VIVEPKSLAQPIPLARAEPLARESLGAEV